MKAGKTISQLADEIERRANSKKDFIAPSTKLAMDVVQASEESVAVPQLNIAANDPSSFPLTSYAHGQLAEYTGIPRAYYNRMQDADPRLLAMNVNRWLHEVKLDKDGTKIPPERRMVRTLDGKVRAVLSDRYRPLENEDLAQAILPVLMDLDLMILSCDITDTRMYIKAVDKAITREIPFGKHMGDGTHTIVRSDTIHPAITIGNSEVGAGTLYITCSTFTDFCTNLATFGGATLRKFHTGSRAELSDEVYALLSDPTKRLTDAALWSQTRDLVKAAFDATRFDATVQKLVDATQQPLGTDIVEVVERVAKRFSFSEFERRGVLQRLIEGADLSRYGLHGAITRHSADVEDYDRATELEKLGGQIIELPRNDFEAFLKAA